jgi:hypothetical protein
MIDGIRGDGVAHVQENMSTRGVIKGPSGVRSDTGVEPICKDSWGSPRGPCVTVGHGPGITARADESVGSAAAGAECEKEDEIQKILSRFDHNLQKPFSARAYTSSLSLIEPDLALSLCFGG